MDNLLVSLSSITREDKDGVQILETDEQLFVQVDVFKERFAGAHDYNTLMSHPNVTEAWSNRFSAWRAQGLI